jgi:uncharacterized membrane protein YozB (DUF420 family)
VSPKSNPWTWLATLNASLNLLAASLLLLGLYQIRRARVDAHRRTMTAAFLVSVVFLASYLVYHSKVGSVPFRGSGPMRSVYLALLAVHVPLAALVPLVAARTLHLGWSDRRREHRSWARLAWPLWMVVSITGVMVYALVYHY